MPAWQPPVPLWQLAMNARIFSLPLEGARAVSGRGVMSPPMRAITTPDWCRNDLLDRGAGSSCISFRPIARTSIRSSGCGASCTETSPTTNATQPSPNSPMRRSASCVKTFRRIGRQCVIRSPTTSASSDPAIFGSVRAFGLEGDDPSWAEYQRAINIQRFGREKYEDNEGLGRIAMACWNTFDWHSVIGRDR